LLKEAAGAAPVLVETSSSSTQTGEDDVFTALPSGVSNATVFNINLSGQGIRGYRFKVGPADTMDCKDEEDYSKPTLVTQYMKLDVTEFNDGIMAVCLMTMDKDGKWTSLEEVLPATWEKDTIAPVGGMTGMPSGTNSLTTLDVAIGGTGGVHDYAYKIGPASSTDCTSSSGYSAKTPVNQPLTRDFSSLADGSLKLCVKTWDEAGNTDAGSIASSTWTKDTTAATAVLTGAPGAFSNGTSLSVTVGGTDVVGYKYKFGAAWSTSCDNGYPSTATPVATSITESLGSLADGNYRLCVVAVDATGNTQASATVVNWVKDTVAPSASAAGAPSGTNNQTTLNVSVDSSAVDYYKYKVGPSSSTTCSDTTGYSGAVLASMPITDDISSVADGAMRLCVIGKDTAGNWQPESSAYSATWTKLTTAPSGATLTGVPTGDSPVTSVTLGVTGANGVTAYKYKFGAGSSSICSSSTGYSSSAIAVGTSSSISVSGADGQYTICVIASDTAGNWVTPVNATTATWTKDTAAPSSVSFSGGPSGTSNSTLVTLSVPASGGIANYQYKAVSGTDCSSSTGYSSSVAAGTNSTVDVSGISDGTVTLCVIAGDSAGNWMDVADASTSTWTKDTTAPSSVSFSGGPTGTSNSTSVTLSVPASGGITNYQYKAISGTDCSSSTGYSSSVAAGTPSTVSLASLADGTVTLCVIASDAYGNWMTAANASTSTWTKDTTPPSSVSFSGGPTGTSTATSFTLSVPSGGDVTTYQYKVVSGSDCSAATGYSSSVAAGTTSSVDVSSLATGTVTLCILGRDSAGNWMTTASTTSWTKGSSGTALTSVSFTGAPSGTSSLTSFTLNVPANGGTVSAYQYMAVSGTDCSNAAGCSSTVNAGTASTVDVSALADGTVTLCVIAQGSSGGWMSASNASTSTWTKNTATSGTTCNAGYYPVSSTCTAVGQGYYSNDGRFRNACANSLPANASWTSSTSTTATCPWFCAAGYTGSSSDGSTGCTAVTGAGVLVSAGSAIDDASYEMNACSGGVSGSCGVPFPFYFNNVNYGNRQNGGMYWGTNNYITFGFGSSQFSGFSAASPGRGIFMNSRDNMMTFLYVATDTPNNIRRFSLNYEGYQYGQASTTTQNIKVELFAMGTTGQILPQTANKCYNGSAWSDCYQVVNVLYGVQMATTGVSAISNGSSYITVYGLPTSATYTSSGSGPYTVTVTSVSHGFSTGQQITVANATSTNANGAVTITRLTGDTFSYSVSANPSSGTLDYTVSPYTTTTTIPIAANLSFSLSSDATGTYWTKSPYVYKAVDGFVLP
jgi:hypothetical protein